MKLRYQLNIAFTTLLVITLLLTGVIIYSLILNLLIQDEQRQLEQKGELLVNMLNERYLTREQFSQFLTEQQLQLMMYDRAENQIIYSTLPKKIAEGFMMYNDIFDPTVEIWEYGQDKFVTSRLTVYPPERGLELILVTPFSELERVRQNYFNRLLLIFFLGALIAIFISYVFTHKMVTPLSQLKIQLKKIEKRKFDEVERIHATGEIKEVEQSVYEMAQSLKSYVETQKVFFQNASHELKTPLMTIQGYAEGIKDQVFSQAEAEKGLDMIVHEVERLKGIMNEMLLLAKIDQENEGIVWEKISIQQLIDEAIARTLPSAQEKSIEFICEHQNNLYLYTDQEKLLRALLNILTNALRYAENRIYLTALKEGRRIKIIIEDDGEGIDPDILPHIFHRFVKGKDGKIGLGLAISQAMVERLGGHIKAGQSTFGGAKFTLSFAQVKKERKT